MGDILDFRRGRRVGGFDIVADGSQPLDDAYKFAEKPAAKSSTSVLNATVCQICGHPMDGKKNASRGKDGKACTCFCHKER